MKTQKFLLAFGLTACVCMPLSAHFQVPSATLTGAYLGFGSSTNYAHSIFVTNLTSINPANTPSNVRYKEMDTKRMMVTE